MIGVEEVGVVLMPPVGTTPRIVVIVVAILGEPYRVHHGPFRMSGIEPLDVVPMPPSGAPPVVTIVICAPSCLSGCSVVASPGKLRERRCSHCERQKHAGHGKSFFQS